MRLLTIVVLLALTGCATTGNYERKLQTWMGHSESDVISRWGPPTNVYQDGDRRYLTWTKVGGSMANATNFGYTAVGVGGTFWCSTTLTSVHGTIQQWRWEGNACKAHS